MAKILIEIEMEGSAFDLMIQPDEVSTTGNAIYRIKSERGCNDAIPSVSTLMLIRDMERARANKGKMSENDKTPSI